MFRNDKRKLRNKVIFSAAGAMVLLFGIWLNYQSSSEEIKTQDTANNIRVEQQASDEQKVIEKEEPDVMSETDTEEAAETYLIKEVEGVVKVFICDENENKELYLITSIPFELLSESDQQLFIEGVKLDTEEDLGKFLESFDS